MVCFEFLAIDFCQKIVYLAIWWPKNKFENQNLAILILIFFQKYLLLTEKYEYITDLKCRKKH